MRTVKLIIEYDGTNYCGWQQQHNGISIQATIRSALETMLKHDVKLIGASRTDAGVHALGQVAHFTTPTAVPCEAFVRGLNTMLPEDVRIRDACDVPRSFHAINDALAKTYRYVISCERIASALNSRRAWHVYPPIDAAAMRRAASVLVGRHDFSAFKAAGSQVKHAVRTISDVAVRRVRANGARSVLPSLAAGIVIEVTGDGFVRHMVRNIVGTLVDIGIGRLPQQAMSAILAGRQRTKDGVCAPAHGLYLVQIYYP